MKPILIFLVCLLLCGCAAQTPAQTTQTTETFPQTEKIPSQASGVSEPPQTTLPPNPVEQLLASLSIEERVGQLFLARCDDTVALEDISSLHLGGFVLFGRDFEGQTPETFREKISGYQAASRLPMLIAVDEEGGTVTRVSSRRAFREEKFPSIRSLYDQGGLDAVLSAESEKCALLKSLGINVNLGPVCDITTDPAAFLYSRSLGRDALTTADVIFEMVWEINAQKTGSVLKHFPGYGNNADTHTGIAVDSRSLEHLEQQDLLPFYAGIRAGCGGIMISHTIVECLDSQLPASLSPAVHGFIRQEMSFDGVLITDDLVMQAITDRYGAAEAAVLAVQAGNDLLCASEYRAQYEAVLAAVLGGRIDFDTLNNAVRRVLRWKMELGLIG